MPLPEQFTRRGDHQRRLGVALAALVIAYISWKVLQSPEQALQFTYNGLSVGAVYALLAMGFTVVYSTVWFFDLSYGAAAAMGAYGVFYLRSQEALGGQYEVNNPIVNVVLGAVVAGVVGWALHAALSGRLRARFRPSDAAPGCGGALRRLGPLHGSGARVPRRDQPPAQPGGLRGDGALLLVGALPPLPGPAPRRASRTVRRGGGARLGRRGARLCAADRRCGRLPPLPEAWAVSCAVAGAVGLALYRGLYIYMRERAHSPLVMLVASLGVLLAVTAAITLVFESAPRPLPEAFGSEPRSIGGASIKGFNLFTIGVAVAGLLFLRLLLGATTFGKQVRAVGDDEEVAKVVGINTTVVIATVFFIGAVLAALAGLLSGHDTAVQPRMGLLLLVKGWIASVVGGIGNLYGALLGGFALGLVEQFGIWDLAGEWRDLISFVVLILFLSFWPTGLLPRR